MSTNLILIDSNLKDTDVLLSALNAQTTGILYKYDTSRNTILHQIDVAFSVKTIERVAICCHGGESRFLENGNFFDLDGSTNEVIKNENTQFVLHLLRTYNVSNIDFLACKSLKYNSWRKFYDLIEIETEGVTVGASEDDTGNVKYGGNWVMENTGEMIDDVYFNDDVKHYHYLMSSLVKKGSNINGELAGDESGHSVSLSSDGTTVAIGAIKNDGIGTNSGHVRVFQWVNDVWTQIGDDIDGAAAWDQSGFSVSLSSDGTIVAIGAIYPHSIGGSVRVFQWVNPVWTQIGGDINGEAAGDQSGYSVSLSSDGTTVAIGATTNDGSGNDSGHVRVFQWVNAVWTQIGGDIDGKFSNDRSGNSVSLSSDGTIVAIGAILNDGTGSAAGHVRVFQWVNPVWTQIGGDIDGEAADDRSGNSVSLSSDGTIVAIGATLNDDIGTSSGHVRVFQWVNDVWTQIGDDIDGEAAGNQSGYSVSLSSDGTTVAIGAKYNSGNGTYSGHVRVYSIITPFEILDFSLTPSNLVDTDVSAILRIEFNKPITGSSPNFNFTLDPSYIATLGTMTDVSNGFVWEGHLTRTPNMNKLGNKLDFDFSYNGVEVSANLVFDVVENSQLVNKNWSLSNSATINNVFTKTLQMSPNGLLMGFINGVNVEIYRKSENWIPDISFVGHQFALTNNYIAIASDSSMQIYDYSGTSWSIMNGGNISYLNIIALSINVDGNVVAVSNNNDVKVLQNESNNWTHINTYNDASVNGLSLSPNGQKLGLGIGTVGEDFSSILVKDVVNNHPPVITLVGDDIINHEINTAYTDFGATAVDLSDGDITGNILTINNVDTSVLGTYTITYDVSNSNNISAIQKRRTVSIVDTTNPVVVLVGDAEVSVNQNSTYTEEGATATDNSNETLTVIVGGDVVDTAILGDYIVLYTATDSTGNTHQISRLVHVIEIGLTIKYTNRTVDILSGLMDWKNQLGDMGLETYKEFTESNNATYPFLNGVYSLQTCGDDQHPDWGIEQIFIDSANSNGFVGIYAPYAHIHNLPIYGNQKGPYNINQYNYNVDGLYRGFTSNYGQFIFYTHTDSNGNTYNGEYLEFGFPFWFQITSLYIDCKVASEMIRILTVLGTNDNITYDYIASYNIIGGSQTNYTLDCSANTNKYKKIKIIIQHTGRNMYRIDRLKMFGDIYTY